ncbi:MAG: dethiobiotin synthase [Pseudomonadota bacterium]
MGLFITGTDTDVGKTYVAGCIALSLREQGFTVAPRKPIASGCLVQTDGSLLSEDALFLQQSTNTKDTLQTICPYQFEPAISPHTAIKQANLDIKISDLVKACDVPDNEFALVEGAGGFYSPLTLDGLNKDLAAELAYQVILVVANRLGCINQALLTIAAIEQAGLDLHSIIVNHVKPNTLTSANYALGMEDFTNIPIFELDYAKNGQAIVINNWII